MRRLVFSILALSAVILGFRGISPSHADGEGWVAAGPMIGHTSAESVRLWVQGRDSGEVTFRLRKDGEETWTEQRVVLKKSSANTAVADFKGLEARARYQYQVVLYKGQRARPKQVLSFKTFPKPGSDALVTIAFGSCAHQRHPDHSIYGRIAADKPNAFLMIGDALYFSRQDVKDKASMWRRYAEFRRRPELQPLIMGTTCYGIWDDHDYGPNNSDKTFPLKAESLKIFKAYWPNRSYGSDGEGGVWTSFSLGSVDVFLLDNRSQRDPNKMRDRPSKTMFGKAQKRWLLKSLLASKARYKVIALGTQFLARYHFFESHQSYRYERKELIDQIMKQGITGVLFLSGDRHLSEVIKYEAKPGQYALYDITSSPLANRAWADGAEMASPRRKLFYGKTNNYGWLEFHPDHVTVQFRDNKGQKVGSLTIKSSELRLKATSAPKRRSF